MHLPTKQIELSDGDDTMSPRDYSNRPLSRCRRRRAAFTRNNVRQASTGVNVGSGSAGTPPLPLSNENIANNKAALQQKVFLGWCVASLVCLSGYPFWRQARSFAVGLVTLLMFVPASYAIEPRNEFRYVRSIVLQLSLIDPAGSGRTAAAGLDLQAVAASLADHLSKGMQAITNPPKVVLWTGTASEIDGNVVTIRVRATVPTCRSGTEPAAVAIDYSVFTEAPRYESFKSTGPGSLSLARPCKAGRSTLTSNDIAEFLNHQLMIDYTKDFVEFRLRNPSL